MAAIEARDEPPGLGRDLDADIDRDDAHQCHDQPQSHVFSAIAQIRKARHSPTRFGGEAVPCGEAGYAGRLGPL
jgi:hypothetical protein